MTQKHSLTTKLIHAGLALAVIFQLLNSLVMEAPKRDRLGDWFFELHEYGGLTAMAFVFLFWLVLVFRKRGTDKAHLFPWFSAEGRARVWQDVKAHLAAFMRFRFPAYEDDGALSSAVHGLGVLVMTVMAMTGTIYYLAALEGMERVSLVRVVLEIHEILSNLAWLYLLGHAALAVIHHYLGDMDLREMWWLRSYSRPSQK